MNPVLPFHCPEIDLLNRAGADATKHQNTARAWEVKYANEKAALASAEGAFTAFPNDGDARALVSIAANVRDLESVVGAFERAGGTELVRSRLIHTPANYLIFARGFQRRADAIGALLPRARKALGAKLAELAEAGEANPLMHDDASSFRAAVTALENAQHAATTAGNYTRQSPPKFDRGFDGFLAQLVAPLPTS